MSVLERSDGARTWWASEGEPVLLVMGLAYPSDMWSRVDQVLARSHRMGNSSWPGLERQPSPSVSTLVVHGEGDRLVPLDQRRMAEAVPGVELVGLQDADHLPFTDRRERTGDLPRNRLACHRDRPGA